MTMNTTMNTTSAQDNDSLKTQQAPESMQTSTEQTETILRPPYEHNQEHKASNEFSIPKFENITIDLTTEENCKIIDAFCISKLSLASQSMYWDTISEQASSGSDDIAAREKALFAAVTNQFVIDALEHAIQQHKANGSLNLPINNNTSE